MGESKVEMRNEMTRSSSSSCLHVFFSGPRHWFAAAPVVTRTLKNFLILQNVLMREIRTVVCVFKFYFHLFLFFSSFFRPLQPSGPPRRQCPQSAGVGP